jgi:hypothetical protein
MAGNRWISVRNRDNKLLDPLGPIGRVDEVNGSGAIETPEYVPTRAELSKLVEHWAVVAISEQFLLFLYAQTCSQGMRRMSFARRRLDRLASVLGDEAAHEAFSRAADEYGKSTDAEAWSVFTHGTTEERAAFQEKVQREISNALGDDSNGRSDGFDASKGPDDDLT